MFDFSGINSMMGSGGFYNLSAMNDMRLGLALSGKDLSSLGSSSGINKYSSMDKGNKTFLKEYQNKMTDLMEAADSLRSDNRKNLAANSSNEEILTSRLRFNSVEQGSYNIDVSQIATKQTTASDGLDAKGKNSLSGNLQIITNGGKELNIDLSTYTNGKTNKDALEDVAKTINRAKAGINAQVVVKEGKASLELSSQGTGEKNSFLVSGSFAEKNGMTTPQQRAQDAQYTVRGPNGQEKSYTSDVNTVRIDGYKIEATLKKAGSANINIGEDISKTSESMEKLVKAYNSALSFLDANAGMGSGIVRQMKNLLNMSVAEKSLKEIGISTAKDGTLSFDKTKFNEAMQKDPKKVNKLISGSFGLADSVYKDAKAGLNIPTQSLMGNALGNSQGGGLGDITGYGSNLSLNSYRNVINYNSTMALLNMMI